MYSVMQVVGKLSQGCTLVDHVNTEDLSASIEEQDVFGQRLLAAAYVHYLTSTPTSPSRGETYSSRRRNGEDSSHDVMLAVVITIMRIV